jgi:hypothetical protein
MDAVWQGIRLAARLLRRTPVLTASAVLMLAVAMGVTPRTP